MAGSASQRCQMNTNKTFNSNRNVHFAQFSLCVCIIWKVGLSPSRASSVVALTVEIISSIKGVHIRFDIYLFKFSISSAKSLNFTKFPFAYVSKKKNKKEKKHLSSTT